MSFIPMKKPKNIEVNNKPFYLIFMTSNAYTNVKVFIQPEGLKILFTFVFGVLGLE